MTKQVYVFTVQVEGSHSQVDTEHRIIMQAFTKTKRIIELNGHGAQIQTDIQFWNPSIPARVMNETARAIASMWGLSKGPLKQGLIYAKEELARAIKDAW